MCCTPEQEEDELANLEAALKMRSDPLWLGAVDHCTGLRAVQM